jgi:hypothetical protein
MATECANAPLIAGTKLAVMVPPFCDQVASFHPWDIGPRLLLIALFLVQLWGFRHLSLRSFDSAARSTTINVSFPTLPAKEETIGVGKDEHHFVELFH